MFASGTASLPLHGGRVPTWLATRMATLGAAIAEIIVLDEGCNGLLRRLSDPLWFQAFGAVLGMDWHSSGITTSVMGALKRGLQPRGNELGLYVCGGRGRHSRRTPDELRAVAERCGLDGEALARTSRLVARVDGNAVQDGFDIYLHSFVVTAAGDWVVIQQGMNGATRLARRYHWRSQAVHSFVEEPHDAVFGLRGGTILNLTDRRSRAAREAAVDLAQQSPDAVVDSLRRITRGRHAQLPAHHEVRASDVFLRRLHGVLAAAQQRDVQGFEEVLLTPGLGPRCMQALALVAEVVHGAPARFDDPARFAFAHGGKDGHPHPVPLRVYDRTIDAMRSAVQRARLGRSDKVQALRRLEQRARQLENQANGLALHHIVDDEWAQSSRLGGMTVLGAASPGLRQRVEASPASRAQGNARRGLSSGKALQLELALPQRPRRVGSAS